MKIQITAFVFSLLCGFGFSFGQSPEFKWVNPLPEGAEPMYDIHMPDAQTIVAAGRDGYILRSGDGGLSWKISRPQDQHLRALDFAGSQNGWAAGDNGAICTTSNAGESWSALSVPGNFNFRDVDFADAQNGWLCGPGVILKTSNGGSAWTNVSPNTFFSANSICFVNPQKGWFCGTTGRIMQTIDGGTTWTDQNSTTSNDLKCIRFLNEQTGWACGVNGTILKTTDGGANWIIQTASGTSITSLKSIAISDAQSVLISGHNGLILKTSNGGNTWNAIAPAQDFIGITGMHVSGNKIAYTLSPQDGFPGTGNIALTTDGGLSWQSLTQNIVPSKCTFRDVIMHSAQSWSVVGNSIDSGYVLKTIDGGLSWSKQVFARGLNAGAFHNSLIGWVVGSNNQISKTLNGGETWITQNPSNVTADYYDVHVLNDQTLCVAGYDDNDQGVIIRSTDGGATWTNTQGIASNSINAVHFTDDQKGWAVGNGGVIRKTSDGGQTWLKDSIEFEYGSLNSVFFTSAIKGFIVGESGRSYKTLNGGQTWTSAGLGGFKGADYSKIKFIHPDTGCAIRTDGKIFYTFNGGESWALKDILPSRSLYALDLLIGGRIVTGGEMAALLTFSGTLATAVSPPFEEAGFSLFPNPTSDFLTIRRIGNQLNVELSDAGGRMFAPVWHSEGQLDLSGLRLGVYFLKITNRGGVVVRKVIRN